MSSSSLESESEKKRCPHDGGACHHSCVSDEDCFREQGLMSLTEPYPGYPLPGHNIHQRITCDEALDYLNAVSMDPENNKHARFMLNRFIAQAQADELLLTALREQLK
jgi:hypothetical protein